MNENLHDKMPSDDIDDLFRSAIEPAEELPSLSVWNEVEKDLDRYNIVNIKRKYNNLKKVAVVLVLVLSSILIYEFQYQHNIFKSSYSAIKNTDNNQVTDNASADKKNMQKNLQPVETSDFPSASAQGPSLQQTKVGPSEADQQMSTTLKRTVNIASTKIITLPFFNAPFNKSSDKIVEAQTGNYNTAARSQMKNTKGADVLPGKIIPGDTYSFVGIDKTDTRALFSSLPALVNLRQSENMYTKSVGKDAVAKAGNVFIVKNIDAGESVAKQAIQLSNRKHVFALSLVFSPDFTSRLIKEDWPVNREDNRDEIRKSERYAFSYSFGALADYSLNKHWGIQSGLSLSRAKMSIGPKFIFARPDEVGDVKYKFNSSSGYSYFSPHSMSFPAFGDSLHAFGSSSSLSYLSVPLAVKYKVSRKNLDLYATAGVAANILIKDKIETSLFRGGNHETAINHDIRGLKPVYYSALLGAGVSYKISQSLAVNFTPTARIALNSINKDGPVKSYQQSLGMIAGVQFTF